MKEQKWLGGIAMVLMVCTGRAQQAGIKMEPVNFSRVQITDAFWAPRIDKVTSVTIPVCIDQTEVKTPRIRNFEKVARKKGEKHEGIYFDDSDVYKALEAIAYSLKNHPDKALEEKADEWISKIAAAQLPDGYLNTYYTLNGLDGRWTDMEKHEDYCAGHLMEAAVAYYNTTGKRQLLDVAARLADHIDSVFRQQGRHWVSGHEEIELALVKLYKATGKEKYLDLAQWYIEQRGHGYGKGVIWDKWKDPKYCQDDVPVRDQKEIEGHAVRAMYLYTGAADVGAAKNDSGYMNAMKQVWEDVVYRNMYITGGIGSSGRNEGFSMDYDLPNHQAYCETCASVGMVLWNQRMNLLTGDAKYVDVLERSLYNGALDGLSLSGDRFFYGNPLASKGNYGRSEWFGTACCPSNIARLVESLGDYIYAASENGIWVNLFVGSNTTIALKKGAVQVSQETAYPWEGTVQVTLTPATAMAFPVYIRIPGWAQDAPVPGDAYRYADRTDSSLSLSVNGRPAIYSIQHGYAVINQRWKKGDVIRLHLPMPVRRVIALDSIKEDRQRVSLQRGPLVYCVEQPDNKDKTESFIVPDDAVWQAGFDKQTLGGVVVIRAELPVIQPDEGGKSIRMSKEPVVAIPYFSWANRGNAAMQVWLPVRIQSVTVKTEYGEN
ncbi:MAG: glycoside hydrolase family 127 protein [Chitinophagaceae bacterium]|nr:glycoside hydrolase family 127 protein [Chitinophagaceae bacterium]